VLVIAGPAGVGKTSTANEVSAQLRASGVAHAVIDTDALDDVYPVPEHQWRLTERNLAFMWEGYHALGIHRLIVTGVYLHDDVELAWLRRATGAAETILVRLTADDDTLAERVLRREIGSGAEAQLARTSAQVERLAAGGGDAVVVDTAGRTVDDVARGIVGLLAWV
jgi:hypothetical protein